MRAITSTGTAPPVMLIAASTADNPNAFTP